jgi:hypothetical protein
VLSGCAASTRNIFYERIALNVDGPYLSGFSIEHPETHRSWFDGLLGHMGNSLTPEQRHHFLVSGDVRRDAIFGARTT